MGYSATKAEESGRTADRSIRPPVDLFETWQRLASKGVLPERVPKHGSVHQSKVEQRERLGHQPGRVRRIAVAVTKVGHGARHDLVVVKRQRTLAGRRHWPRFSTTRPPLADQWAASIGGVLADAAMAPSRQTPNRRARRFAARISGQPLSSGTGPRSRVEWTAPDGLATVDALLTSTDHLVHFASLNPRHDLVCAA